MNLVPAIRMYSMGSFKSRGGFKYGFVPKKVANLFKLLHTYQHTFNVGTYLYILVVSNCDYGNAK